MTPLLAIDPGTRSSGWAVYHGQALMTSGTVRASRLGLLIARIRERIAILTDEAWTTPGDHHMLLAVERAPVTSRRGHPADLYMPGLAAGVWVGLWADFLAPSPDTDPILIPAGEWQRAMLRGHPGGRKAASIAVAMDIAGRPVGDDEADAICIGWWAARREAG